MNLLFNGANSHQIYAGVVQETASLSSSNNAFTVATDTSNFGSTYRYYYIVKRKRPIIIVDNQYSIVYKYLFDVVTIKRILLL